MRPKRRFGQHFLCDPQVIERIVAAFAPGKGQHIVEIGPGRGALTVPLLRQVDSLDVIEMDRDLAESIGKQFGHKDGLRIHQADALRFDLGGIARPGEKLRLVGNLPYNISSPLLFHLLDQLGLISDMLFMFQKEVAERLTAAPGTRRYGRLSVMVGYRCQVYPLFSVGADVFDPPPKVDSAVVRLLPRDPPLTVSDHGLLKHLVTKAFGQRRKTLRNALRGVVDEAIFQAVEISSNDRGETLSISDYIRLANYLARVDDKNHKDRIRRDCKTQ